MERRELETSRVRWRRLALLLALLLLLVLGYLWPRPATEVVAPAEAVTAVQRPPAVEPALDAALDGGPVPEELTWDDLAALMRRQGPRPRSTGGPPAGGETPLAATARADGSGASAELGTANVAIPTRGSSAGSISGRISWSGVPPVLPPLAHGKDQKTCGASGPDDSLLIDSDGGIANVVVWATSDELWSRKTVETDATLDQQGCAYVPRVQAVAVGTILTVVNSDPILHIVHASIGAAVVFNYAMPIKRQKIPAALRNAGIIRLQCDRHNWMSGAIAVLPTPYFAVTGLDGSFSITGVEPGQYQLYLWHERAGSKRQTVDVRAGETSRFKASFSRLVQ